MTPKDKAKELVDKFIPILDYGQTEKFNQAKKCAVICVEEIIKCTFGKYNSFAHIDYWEKVKQEINKL